MRSVSDMRHDNKPVILMYHSIVPYEVDPSRTTVHPQRFEQHMRWLHQRGRRGTSVRELLEARQNGAADGLVGITFDDGYSDFIDNALPVLQRYGFNATVFMLGGRLGGDNSWIPDDPRKDLLTAEQIKQLAASGIEIGSHGLLHPSLPSVDEATLADELQNSRRVLQDVSGQEVPGFAYPFGHLDARAFRGVQDAGYDYACSVWPTEFSGPYALTRINVLDKYSYGHLWYKGIRHWLRWEYEGVGSRALVAGDAWVKRLRSAPRQEASVAE